ncbi:MAG TPA: VOC family protein [Symbiobacteriaceae bacterium]|nr:VOC family protein [Symbiobacteriaceae bacterium]
MTMRLNPYLVLNGNAKEAIGFYEKALDAKVMGVMTFGEAPPDPNFTMPDEVKDRVMHAMMKVGETDLMFSDTFPGQPFQTGNQVMVTIVTDDVEQAKKAFDALAEGGRVDMPLQATFWSPAYGSLTDKFGVAWQISAENKQG